jgi:aspartyl-tRNA(Asn)/glutamyl-tRNA(Gln) amidotransferase subunit C
MSISRDEVLHVARLAELAVDETELPRLVDQMGRIVDYVAQLSRVPAGTEVPEFVAGPESVTLRDDEVNPVPLARPLAAMAPEFRQGLFIVPRLGAMEGE